MTIPFRTSNSKGDSPSAQLEERIKILTAQLKIDVSDSEIIESVKNATDLANRDAVSFSYSDFKKFQVNTWQLLLEGNPVFKNPMFTISQYRTALLKVERFYNQLNPNLIYHPYHHSPEELILIEEMTARAKLNISMGQEYFQTRILTMAVLEAIAEYTGGDVPLMLFAGQMAKSSNFKVIVMEDFLDLNVPEVTDAEVNPTVLTSLNEMLFDAISTSTKKLTMSAYLYSRISKKKKLELFERARALFDKKLKPLDFLKQFDKRLVHSLINSIIKMETTRTDRILKLRSQLD